MNTGPVRTMRVPQSIDEEMDRRWFWMPWYLNRKEFTIVFMATAMVFGVIYGAVDDLLGICVLPIVLPLAMWGMSLWKRAKPPSYMWDTCYRIGLVRVRERWLPRQRGLVRLVCDERPHRSVFAGTRQGGCAATEPWHRLAQLPIGVAADDAGFTEPAVGMPRLVLPRRRLLVELEPGPAPVWHGLGDRPPWWDEGWYTQPVIATRGASEGITDD